MFLERTGNGFGPRGWIEVICGSMFSGKTEELIRRLRRAEFARMRVETFKPAVDTRYDDQKVVSHNATALQSTAVRSSTELLTIADDVQVVGIDEAQFFDGKLPEVCATLAARGMRLIVAGLDMDFQGRPFGPMPQLLSIAEFVTKVHAICMRCGELATFSHRLHHSTDLIHLGETDSYEPLCRPCFEKARAEQAAMVKTEGAK